MNCSPPSSSLHGTCPLFETPWTVTHQAPPPMGFSRQEYWSGLPFPSPGDLPDPGIELRSPALQADALTSEPPGKPKITGVGSLSFLQWIFPTQESNSGLPHCRRILYELRYQGSLILIYVGYEQHSSYHPLFLNSANIVNVALISSNPDPYESSPHNTLIWAGLEQYLIQYCHGKR